jgi:two-component system response regulator RegX3
VTIDLGRHVVSVDGLEIDLTRSEFRLLLLLAEAPEQVFTRDQIMEHLWQTPYVGDTRACDAHVSNLRRKIERDPAHPERIITVREVGYKLVAA